MAVSNALGTVKEFVRLLSIAERHYHLYPSHGKVVRQSLAKAHAALCEAHKAAGSEFDLDITRSELTFESEVVYHEKNAGRSLAEALYKDSVRKIVFLETASLEEVIGFISCFKELRQIGTRDADFETLFWEKDATHIGIETTDRFVEESELPDLFSVSDPEEALQKERFEIDAAEEESLREDLEVRETAPPGGDSTFDFTEDDLKGVEDVQAEVGEQLPLCDLLDILLELMVQNKDARSAQFAQKSLRPAIFVVIENGDFIQASALLERLRRDHKTLEPAHRRALLQVARSFSDRSTVNVVASFLKESPKLPESHEVFAFLKLLGSETLPLFSDLLALRHQSAGVNAVLVDFVRQERGNVSGYLSHPDPTVACAVMRVIVNTAPENAAGQLAKALSHPEELVRQHAATVLLDLGGVEAAKAFLPLLGSESSQLSYLAVQFYAKVGYPKAGAELTRLIRAKRFQDLDCRRQEVYYRAFVRAGRERAVAVLGKDILSWSLRRNAREEQRKAAALKALSAHPTAAAMELLLQIAGNKKSTLASTAREVLQSVKAHHRKERERAKTTG